jgi:hypothetical protein
MRATPLMTASAAVLFLSGPLDGQHFAPPSRPEPLDVEMFYQFSQTGNDAEVTIGVESGKAIDVLVIVGPHGRRVGTVQSKDRLGLAEIELESAEPSVEEVQRAYPVGTYRLWARAVDGTRLEGRIGLTHDVVAAPDFFTFSPCNEDIDPTNPVTIQWNLVAGAAGGYEIILEQDDTGANLRITLTPDKTTFVIPDGFLVSGLEYEIEMKSVTAGGNKTSASCAFNTR